MTRTILIASNSSGTDRATAKHFHEHRNVIATMRDCETADDATLIGGIKAQCGP
ncbi:hypothetical protein [Streptomyces sp. NPDC048720]|uniref:hypothetical protein n=1 Tax=Streptomyces sp. NPDC048720 TaxID=3365588 RepID=UPI003716E86E